MTQRASAPRVRTVSRRRSRGPRPRRAGRRWTAHDDAQLRRGWGETTLRRLGIRLARTLVAVLTRARRLGLGRARQGRRSVQELARESGYGAATLVRAARLAGLVLPRAPRSAKSSRTRSGALRRPSRTRALDDALCDQILAVLAAKPDGARLPMNGPRLTAAAAWGTGGKPAGCLGCGAAARPHYARGRCNRCWQAARARGGLLPLPEAAA